jgi:hypothetical protein
MSATKKLPTLALTLLLAVSLLSSLQTELAHADPIISRVQSTSIDEVTGANLVLTWDSAPQVGSVIMVTVGYFDPAEILSVLSQSGVTNWTKQVERTSASGTVAIYSGLVTSEASTILTIAFSESTIGAAMAHEYTGLASFNLLDKTATAEGSSTTVTTGTITETTYPNELWLGAAYQVTTTNSSGASNGFTLFSGNGLYVFEKIATTTGNANSSVTTSAGSNYLGVIAAFHSPTSFIITASDDAHSAITPSGEVNVTQGANQTFTISTDAGYSSVVYVDGANMGSLTEYTFVNVQTNHNITVFSGSYTINGPYYEDNGAVANTVVDVTVYYTNGETETLTLNGTTGVAQTVILNGSLTPSYISWQAISNFSYTRLYYLTDTTEAAIKIFIPNVESTAAIYQFTIADFYTMTNPYLASGITVDGALDNQFYIIERKPLTVSTVSLIMEQWHSYTLVFECDQGTYTQVFSAESTFLTNINILSGAFPANVSQGVTVDAERVGSEVDINYVDGDNLTSWVNASINHYVGAGKIVDYSLNVSGSILAANYTGADPTVNYEVVIYANQNGTIHRWILQLPADVSANPFTGIFDFLGDWEINGQTIDPAQLIAAFLICLALAVGSVFSLGFGCVFAWIIGGVCIAVGWWQASLPIFGLAGFISIFIAIEEAKRTVREA